VQGELLDARRPANQEHVWQEAGSSRDRIEDVAREIGMSVSGFHAHFKAVTAKSPLQFQKRLRLQEARRLMLTESLDAAEAGFQVGYDDASHFSWEYKPHFGDPPLREIQGLRELTLISEAA
jgi:AraC-like DNA-binding protein